MRALGGGDLIPALRPDAEAFRQAQSSNAVRRSSRVQVAGNHGADHSFLSEQVPRRLASCWLDRSRGFQEGRW
jgi:hypothetical protein